MYVKLTCSGSLLLLKFKIRPALTTFLRQLGILCALDVTTVYIPQYQRASTYFSNLDLLMSSLSTFQQWNLLNISSALGPRFKDINMFYSSPDYYTSMKYQESKDKANREKIRKTFNGNKERSNIRQARETPSAVDWKIKHDDFFPYSDCPHCFWTGYFTSRTAFKRLERVGSSFLLAARQIDALLGRNKSTVEDDAYLCSGRRCRCDQPLYDLEDAMGVAQHHDGVSGTAKQHVSDDYSKRVQAGIDKASEYVANKLKRLLAKDAGGERILNNLSYCQLINETICEVSQVCLCFE